MRSAITLVPELSAIDPSVTSELLTCSLQITKLVKMNHYEISDLVTDSTATADKGYWILADYDEGTPK